MRAFVVTWIVVAGCTDDRACATLELEDSLFCSVRDGVASCVNRRTRVFPCEQTEQVCELDGDTYTIVSSATGAGGDDKLYFSRGRGAELVAVESPRTAEDHDACGASQWFGEVLDGCIPQEEPVLITTKYPCQYK